MRRLIAFVMIGLATAFVPVHADQSSSMVTDVGVRVVSNVAVSTSRSLWDLGDIQTTNTQSLVASIEWNVSANVEQLQFCLEASDLFKGNDPLADVVEPIHLDVTRPAHITSVYGGPNMGYSSDVAWISTGRGIVGDKGTFPTMKSDSTVFDSAQGGIWNMNPVTTQIFYTQGDNTKPTGEYSGKVKLLVMMPAPPE